jgi:hypothetical protein
MFDPLTSEFLNNGAKIIARHLIPNDGWVMLCIYNGPQRFVCWRVTPDGHAFWGNYYTNLAKAVENFETRTGHPLTMTDMPV